MSHLFHGDTFPGAIDMMAVRLIKPRRVLKAAGSLCLRCDPAASHCLKILPDAVFRARCFKK